MYTCFLLRYFVKHVVQSFGSFLPPQPTLLDVSIITIRDLPFLGTFVKFCFTYFGVMFLGANSGIIYSW